MSERWKRIPRWTKYEVSDLGRIRRGSRILKPVPVQSGYGNYKVHRISLSDRKRRWDIGVAYLVLLVFEGAPQRGQIVRHYDDDQSNNKRTNLSWGTHKQNGEDRSRNGLTKVGISNGNSTLTEEEVRQIRALYQRRSKRFGLVPLSKRFKVCPSTIGNIINRRIWRHIS